MSLGLSLYNVCTLGMSHLIGLRDPVGAMNYVHNRNRFLSYSAASRRGHNSKWRPKNRTEDENIKRDWAWVTARARDLDRNSAHVSGALDRICGNVVFSGIRPQVQLRDSLGNRDRTRNRVVEDHWKRWAEHERVNLYDKQGLALRHCWVDGEVLLHFYESPRLLDSGVVPLGVELLEADYLDSSVHGDLANGNRAVRGVELDGEGFPVAYHVFTEHPGGLGVLGRSTYQSRRIPAERMLHIFRPKRGSQTRGLSWLASIIMTMRDFDEYQASERIAARLVSAFGFFVETNIPEGMNPALWGGLPGSASAAQEGGEQPDVPDFVEAGRVQVLPYGTRVRGEGFKRPGDTYEPFTKTTLREGSAGFGMSYEAFSNNYSDANYSSARSASLEERRGYQCQQFFLNRRFNIPTWGRWSQMLFLSGLASQVGPEIPVSWQTPGWPWVDPTKDSASAELELNMGVTSRRRIAAAKGVDLEEVTEELREEQELFGGQNKEDSDAQAQEG